MRLVLVVIAALLVAIVATLAALEDPGYVLIARHPWSLETSLPVFAVLALAAVAAVIVVAYLVVRLVRIPRDVARWRAKRTARQSREALYQGLLRLAEGNWAEAEANFVLSLRGSEMPLIAYLGAACAAQGQGNLEKRDEQLAAAQRSAPQHHLAIGMMQANLQYLAHQPEQALATLSQLRQEAPKHHHVLKLLAQLYLDLRDWTNLAELIAPLRQHQALPEREIDALELRAHRELLMLSLPSGSLEPLRKAWNAVPKALRRQPAFIAIYARHLIQQQEMNEAEALLRDAIAEEWDDALVELYGLVQSEQPEQQLETAESWRELYPDNPKLLLTLGRLAIYCRQDQKAAGYLEKCVNLRGPIEAYRELGALLERLGDKDRALACYRRGTEAYSEETRPVPAVRSGLTLVPRQRALH
ncbi:MAG TPA: heme biosynthesis HemY N-terminal domain-containing protein [Burkholderiales bacterium]